MLRRALFIGGWAENPKKSVGLDESGSSHLRGYSGRFCLMYLSFVPRIQIS